MYGVRGSNLSLREDSKLFKNLKQMSLVDGGSASSAKPRSQIPGSVELVTLSRVEQDLASRNSRYEMDPFQIRAEYLEKNLTKKEKEVGIPDVQIVGAILVPTLPGYDWERDFGEPYVRTSVHCTCILLTI